MILSPSCLSTCLCFCAFVQKAVSAGWSSDKGSLPGWQIVMHCHENNEANLRSRWLITPNNLCGGGKNAAISQALLIRIGDCPQYSTLFAVNCSSQTLNVSLFLRSSVLNMCHICLHYCRILHVIYSNCSIHQGCYLWGHWDLILSHSF